MHPLHDNQRKTRQRLNGVLRFSSTLHIGHLESVSQCTCCCTVLWRHRVWTTLITFRATGKVEPHSTVGNTKFLRKHIFDLEYTIKHSVPHGGKGPDTEFFISWNGYSTADDTAEPGSNIQTDLLTPYLLNHRKTYA